MVDKQKILDYAEILLAHCRVSLTYLETYRSLINRHSMHHDVMLEAVVFFNIVEKALVSSLMMEACKLFEDDPNVMSVTKLINVCEQNQKLFDGIEIDCRINDDILPFPFSIAGLLKETKAALTQNNDAIKNLKNQRDQLWAHNDKKYFLNPQNLESKYPISMNEINTLLLIVCKFTNTIILAFTKSVLSPYFYTPNACDLDVERLIYLMELGLEKENNNDGQAEI